MGRACSTNGEKRNTYRLMLRNPEGKRSVLRPRRRWMINIKMDLGKTEWGRMDWLDMAQDKDQWRALVNTVMNLRVPLNTGKLLNSCTTVGLSRRTLLRGVS
jgi:hypothetical protein